MSEITEKELISKGIRHVDYEGEKYFCIIDINPQYPHVKYTPLNVKILKPDGEEMKFVKAKDIEPMNDFDKMVLSVGKK